MAKTNFVKGSALMIFDEDGKSYAYATNHTLTLTATTSDVSSKDHGLWSGSEIEGYTWEITTENLYTEADYEKFFDKMIAGGENSYITLKFGVKSQTDPMKTVVDGDYDNWTPTTHYYTGKAYITSLTTNAQNGENATYSATFTGIGQLKKEGTAPTTTSTTTADTDNTGE